MLRDKTLTVTIYQIQFADPTKAHGPWHGLADHAADFEPVRISESLNSCTNGFHASGICWQQTGIHGTYDFEYAKRCLIKARERDTKGWVYRLIRRDIAQVISVLQEESWDALG